MPDPSKRAVMVVDDDPAIRESIAVFLQAHGYEASSATDGYDALWQLTKHLVDIIVSDLEMPGLSGLEFLSVIHKRYPQTLVVAMSETPEDQSELGSGGADGFYAKGQHPKKLLSTIARLLRESALQGRTQKIEPREVRFTGYRRDIAGTPHVLLTCPECLKSFSVVAASGIDWRETREASCIPCETNFGHAPASSRSTVPARQASRTEYPRESGLDNLGDSTKRLANRVLCWCRYLWCGLAGRRFPGGPSAGASIGKPGNHEGTGQPKGGTQASPALHGDGWEQWKG